MLESTSSSLPSIIDFFTSAGVTLIQSGEILSLSFSDFSKFINSSSLTPSFKYVNKVTSSSILLEIFFKLKDANKANETTKSVIEIQIIEAKDRKSAGPTSSPEGLYLKNVFY